MLLARRKALGGGIIKLGSNMDAQTTFIIGLIIGMATAAISFCVVLALYKYERIIAKRHLAAAEIRLAKAENASAMAAKSMLEACDQLERLAAETDRLREEKLHAWHVPDEI
jgi:hypothetical protein